MMLVKEVAQLTGVSVRTLHYYDEVGLLNPEKDDFTGYRYYSDEALELLQQILLYKELQYSLREIKLILEDSNFNILESLRKQRQLMQEKRKKLNRVIELIDTMIDHKEENKMMKNEDKFNVFKEKLIADNEDKYGQEARTKHGEDSVLATYGKLRDMTEEQYEAVISLEKQLFARLAEAMNEEQVERQLKLEIAELHKRWLAFYWPKYTKQAHAGLAQLYLIDERFTHYYDALVQDGATELLVRCIEEYTTS